ncbi:MAG: hypothetical protein NTX85_01570 [Candidatus Nomurabacteria bacterium]|nr:hypothetical protein [Candidatus Nomurabacteria bacterium]
MQENEKLNKIEEVKRKLYDRNTVISNHDRQGVLHQIPHQNISGNWQNNDGNIMKKPPQSKFFKYFFITTIVFFIFAIFFAVYMFMQGSTSVSNDNIDISVLGNSFTEGGKELQLQVEVVNKNKSDLELSNLIVEYPRGASDDATDVMRLPRENIGTIPAGGRATKIFKVTLYGDQGSVRNVNIKLEYHPAGSNAIFTKDQSYPVTINSSPISLLVDAPASTSANQSITFKVTATLNTTIPQEGAVLTVSYPQGFIFENATPSPDSSNYVWDLSGLTQSNPITIAITGHMVGQDGDEQAFHVYAGTKKPGQQAIDVVYNSFLHIVNIVKPFLDTKVVVNGNDVDAPSVSGGEKVNAEIFWSNNLKTTISDPQLVVKFSGNALDKNKIGSDQGFYDSLNNQIIWNKNSAQNFSSISPGQSGSFSFNFTPISVLNSEVKISDPQIVIEVSIRGQQVESGNIFTNVDNFSKKVVKISSNFQLAGSANYFSGELPPRAENETKYKINWILSNSSNPVKNAEARAVLPVYVKWLGRLSGNAENISYNESTREVIWKIGNVNPDTGFDSNNREADFVISLNPSVSQIGTVPVLTKDVYLIGDDSFTKEKLKFIRKSLNTFLYNDPNFKSGDERVIK